MYDGAGAVLKQNICWEQLNMNVEKIQRVGDVVATCLRKQKEEHPAYENIRSNVNRFFHLIEEKNVCRVITWDCKPIPG